MHDTINDRDLTRVRRLAARAGYRIWKVRDGNRWAAQYGPLALIDTSTHAIVHPGLATPAEVEDWLAGGDA